LKEQGAGIGMIRASQFILAVQLLYISLITRSAISINPHLKYVVMGKEAFLRSAFNGDAKIEHSDMASKLETAILSQTFRRGSAGDSVSSIDGTPYRHQLDTLANHKRTATT
jgi:hypothetical protein